jgi:hypothetical protein
MKTLQKRATIYFDPDLHRALRLKAAAMAQSVSELVNRPVKLSLAEDEEDLAAFAARAHVISFPSSCLGTQSFRPSSAWAPFKCFPFRTNM